MAIIARSYEEGEYAFPEYLDEFDATEINAEDFLDHAYYLIRHFPEGEGTYFEMRGFLEDPALKAADEVKPREQRDKGRSKFFSVAADGEDTFNEMLRTAREWLHEGRGIFFGIHPRSRPEGTSDAVSSLAVLPIDSDVAGDPDKIARVLMETQNSASLVLLTGNGVHAYLNIEPVEKSERYKQVVKMLASCTVGGDTSINDFARVMRAGGTWNLKRANADCPKRVSVVLNNPEQDVFDLDDFTVEAPPSGGIVAKATTRDRVRASDAKMGNRHDVVKRYAADYRNRAESQEEFEAAVMTFNNRLEEPLPDNEVESICEHRWSNHDGNGVSSLCRRSLENA
jgi:primase-like protein